MRAHDEASTALLHQPRDCTGHAFVTFVDADAAAAAVAAINAGITTIDGQPRALSVLLPGVAVQASRAPDPRDVQWENLQFSRRERWRRHINSTLLMLLLASFGSAVIAGITYASGAECARVGNPWRARLPQARLPQTRLPYCTAC